MATKDFTTWSSDYELQRRMREGTNPFGQAAGNLPVTAQRDFYASATPKRQSWLERNRHQLAIGLGKTAQAVMGPFQQSFPAQLGKFGVELGRSGILDEEAQSQLRQQEAHKNLMRDYLSGKSPTAPDRPGLTSVKTELGPDGETTVSLSGLTPQQSAQVRGERARLQKEELGVLGQLAQQRTKDAKVLESKEFIDRRNELLDLKIAQAQREGRLDEIKAEMNEVVSRLDRSDPTYMAYQAKILGIDRILAEQKKAEARKAEFAATQKAKKEESKWKKKKFLISETNKEKRARIAATRRRETLEFKEEKKKERELRKKTKPPKKVSASQRHKINKNIENIVAGIEYHKPPGKGRRVIMRKVSLETNRSRAAEENKNLPDNFPVVVYVQRPEDLTATQKKAGIVASGKGLKINLEGAVYTHEDGRKEPVTPRLIREIVAEEPKINSMQEAIKLLIHAGIIKGGVK